MITSGRRTGRDIVPLSFAFTLGVAAAGQGGRTFHLAAALAASAGTVFIIFATAGGGRISRQYRRKNVNRPAAPEDTKRRMSSEMPYIVLFVLLGIFCQCTAALSQDFLPAGRLIGEYGSRVLGAFTALIDSIDWPHESSGALVKALLTGRREALGAEVIKDFRAAGASHILALSGLHLGVIYALMCALLTPLGRSRPAAFARALLVVSASAFYSRMTGNSASVERAFIFIALRELSRMLPGREVSSMRILGAALILQLAIRPALISTPGFQLSYLAMLGILTVHPVLRSVYPAGGRLNPFRRLWDSFSLSVSCQLLTAPAVWLHFGSLPKYFIITNIVALPLTEATIIGAVATIILSAAGIDPGIAKSLTDALGQALLYSLKVIASL